VLIDAPSGFAPCVQARTLQGFLPCVRARTHALIDVGKLQAALEKRGVRVL
jgi:hypothetical protein